MYKIQQKHAQPSMINNLYIQPISVHHHLFVNNRARWCSQGLAVMTIHPESGWRVAQDDIQKIKQVCPGIFTDIAK